MGYLDNTSVTVDAILTNKGRELLSKGDGTFILHNLRYLMMKLITHYGIHNMI